MSGSYNDGTLTINVNGVSGDINFPDSLTGGVIYIISPEINITGSVPVGYLVYSRGVNMNSSGTSMSDSVTIPMISCTSDNDDSYGHVMSGMDWIETTAVSNRRPEAIDILFSNYLISLELTPADYCNTSSIFENMTFTANYSYTYSAGNHSMAFPDPFLMDVDLEGYLMYFYSTASSTYYNNTYCAVNESGEPSRITIRITQGSSTVTWTNTERLYLYHPTSISSGYFAQLILAPIYE